MVVINLFLCGVCVGILLNTHIIYFEKSQYLLQERNTRQYWYMGILNAGGWLVVYDIYGLTPRGCTGLFVFSLLLIIALIDIEHYLIPNEAVVFLLLAGITYHVIESDLTIFNRLLGLSVGLLIPIFIAILSYGSIGGGDIKLLSAMGFWVGFPGILYVLITSSLAGGIFSLILLALGRKKQKESIPFAPFLAAGFILIYFFPKYFV
jgi:leader peptidase (prepilin peptidase)/N-methyltransferase